MINFIKQSIQCHNCVTSSAKLVHSVCFTCCGFPSRSHYWKKQNIHCRNKKSKAVKKRKKEKKKDLSKFYPELHLFTAGLLVHLSPAGTGHLTGLFHTTHTDLYKCRYRYLFIGNPWTMSNIIYFLGLLKFYVKNCTIANSYMF